MIKFPQQLTEGTLLKRYKRFFADVEYTDASGKKVQMTIHCPNTGSLKTVIEKDQTHDCWFSISNDPERKLKGTLEAVKSVTGAWVGVNTSWPNKVVQLAAQQSIDSGRPFFKGWQDYSFYKSEHKISKETRLDGVFCIDEAHLKNDNEPKHFIEIKNVSLARNGHAQFPDGVTERGQKHLIELMNLIEEGHRAELIFTIQRDDVQFFSIAEDFDPEYKRLFDKALKKGLVVTPVLVSVTRDEIKLLPKILPLA